MGEHDRSTPLLPFILLLGEEERTMSRLQADAQKSCNYIEKICKVDAKELKYLPISDAKGAYFDHRRARIRVQHVNLG